MGYAPCCWTLIEHTYGHMADVFFHIFLILSGGNIWMKRGEDVPVNDEVYDETEDKVGVIFRAWELNRRFWHM